MSIAKAFAKYGRNILVEMAKEKAIDTTFKATSSIKNKLNKEVDNIINDIQMAPTNLKHEILRQISSREMNTFVRNTNMSNYDYFNNYYSHYNKRYTPTPIPNLAEQLRQHELNLNKHRR